METEDRIRALELKKKAGAPVFLHSSHFSAFEHIAALLNWPKEFCSLLLQCKLEAYEVMQEAYGQNICVLFDKRCQACSVKTVEEMILVILLVEMLASCEGGDTISTRQILWTRWWCHKIISFWYP